jgi:SNF2 family DNA or RNA helicase
MIYEGLKGLLAKYATEMNGDTPELLVLSADLNSEKRMEVQDKFNSSKRAFMVASTLASGEGLNLQTCSDCVMHERQWNPANEEQAEGRFIRIGQLSDKVNAVYVEAEDTVDSHLDGIVSRKRIEFHKVMSSNPNAGHITWNEGNIISELVKSIVASYNKGKAA